MALPDKPLTRQEMYLSRIAGENTELPREPLTREEMYLEAIANGGGGVTPEELDARVKQLAGAPTTSTEGVVGQLIEDTENGELYQLTGTEGGSATVDTDAGLTSNIPNVTFTITNATTFNNKLSGFSLQVGTYAVAKGSGNTFIVVSEDGTTTYGTLTGFNAASLPNGLGVTPNPVAAWMTAFSQAPVGRSFFKFNMVAGSTAYIWEKVGGGPTVVQTTGNSTTDVMSQNATTNMIWQDVAADQKVIRIGNNNTDNYAFGTINIGAQYARSNDSVVIGSSATLYGSSSGSVIIGNHSHTPISGATGSVAIGYQAGDNIDHAGMVDFGTTNTYYGYDSNSNYRVVTGVHDAQNAHDAVTLGQLNALITELQNLGINVSLQGASSSSSEPTVTCPNCQQQTSEMSPICEHCGYDLSGGGGESPDDPAEPAPEDAEAPAEG